MEIITTSSTSTAGEAHAPTASPRPPAWSGGAPLPARLRRVLEQLSGYDLRDVRVYPGSPWPARLSARAFVFGSDIHLSPGAEDALEHEAWHVVQQKQGRVRPTSCLQAHRLGVVGLNDEEALEREADMMGLLTRGLVPRGAVLPMTGALCIAPLHQAVVQRQVTVSGVEITNVARLQEEIKLRLYLMGHDVVGFATIIADMLRENLVFKTWREVRRELRVREVGYQVETSMRQLAGDHAQRFRTASTQLSAALNSAPRASLRERDAIADTVYKEAGVIRWGNASFLQYKNKDLHMFKWLEGRRQQEPLRMNCWEAVLYALVRTGLVDKSYITWCNKRHPTGTTEMQNLDITSNLTVSILENMDYYFWAPGLAPKMARRDKQKLPEQRGKSQGIQIPSDMVIPRGRILMFAFNAHVALSTGNIVNNKHEILELDGSTSTIQLGTIEDLSALYRESMVVAPFPICGYKATAQEATAALKSVGYAADQVGNGLKSAYGTSAEEAAKLLKGAGYAVDQVGSALKVGWNSSADTVSKALKGSGYGVNEVGTYLKNGFNLGADALSNALKAAGYASDEIGKLFKSFGGEFSKAASKLDPTKW